MSPQIKVPGWSVIESYPRHVSYRTFDATPIGGLDFEYETQERYGQRYIKAVYPARLERVAIHWRWDDTNQTWWASRVAHFRLINESTGQPYKTGWKAERIQDRENITDHLTEHLLAPTRPTTRIRVVEEEVE